MQYLDFISYIADVIIFFLFLKQNGKMRMNLWLTLSLMVAMRAGLIMLLMPYMQIPYIKIPVAISSMFVLAILFFKNKIIDSVINVFFFQIACILSEFGVMIIFSFIFEGRALSRNNVTERIYLMVGIYVLILCITQIITLIRKKNKIRYSTSQAIMMLSTAWLIAFYAPVLGVMGLHEKNIKPITYGAFLGVAGMFTVIVIVYRMCRIVRLEEEHRLGNEQLEAQKKRHDVISARYMQIRKLRHDCSNHIQTLKILADMNDSEKLDKYINQLCDLLEETNGNV